MYATPIVGERQPSTKSGYLSDGFEHGGPVNGSDRLKSIVSIRRMGEAKLKNNSVADYGREEERGA